jgi:hypothetical protein
VSHFVHPSVEVKIRARVIELYGKPG